MEPVSIMKLFTKIVNPQNQLIIKESEAAIGGVRKGVLRHFAEFTGKCLF